MLDTLEYPQSQMTLLEGSDHIHKVSGSDREIVDALMQFTEFDFASLVVNIYDLWNFGRTKAIREFLEKKRIGRILCSLQLCLKTRCPIF